jgi:DNA-binding NarL/FixJ family response regulator
LLIHFRFFAFVGASVKRLNAFERYFFPDAALAMDYTSRIKEFRNGQRQVLSWMFTSLFPQRVVVACGNRLTMLLIGQVLVRPKILCAAVTSEAEAAEALAAHQAGFLVVVDPLEVGDVISLCRLARQQQPKLRILLFLSEANASALQSIDSLVDAVVHELDLGDDEYPLVKAFMAIVRAGRYRSPSLRQKQQQSNDTSASALRSGAPQLTAREQGVLELISHGLSDRQIATNLGLSYETVRTYVKAVRRKLGSKNRLAAAAWAWRRHPSPNGEGEGAHKGLPR